MAKEEFSKQDIIQGLTYVANYVRAHASEYEVSLPVTAVVAGGVLGVLHLDGQPLVKQIEFLHREESAEHLLCVAANAASRSFEWHNDQWLNNDIQYFVTLTSYCKRYSVYNDALQQNVVMWQIPRVLKLIAAPWKWQLHNKLTRLIRIYNRDEDFEDAISLVRIMILQRGRSLTATEIGGWDYGRDRPLFITSQLLATIQCHLSKEKYVAKYGGIGIQL